MDRLLLHDGNGGGPGSGVLRLDLPGVPEIRFCSIDQSPSFEGIPPRRSGSLNWNVICSLNQGETCLTGGPRYPERTSG